MAQLGLEVRVASEENKPDSTGETGDIGDLEEEGEPQHLWVREVATKGPADRAGIQISDQIMSVRGVSAEAESASLLAIMLDSKRVKAKESFEIVLMRGSKEILVVLVADADPAE